MPVVLRRFVAAEWAPNPVEALGRWRATRRAWVAGGNGWPGPEVMAPTGTPPFYGTPDEPFSTELL